MLTKRSLIFAALILAAFLVAMGGRASQEPFVPEQNGRFTITVTLKSDAFLLDTQSGTVWGLNPETLSWDHMERHDARTRAVSRPGR